MSDASQPSDATPLQSPKPELQTKLHALLLQTALALVGVGQMLPHIEQFFGSIAVFVQVVPQSFEPPRQSMPHIPIEQTCPAGQTFPHDPQCFGSFCSSTQFDPQSVEPPRHWTPHVPFEQT